MSIFRGWNATRNNYMCADGANVRTPDRALMYKNYIGDAASNAVFANVVSYERDWTSVRLIAAGSEFGRNMS